MNNREYIGERIAEIRQAKGLSIRQLAEASGVNFANIYKIENGKYNVRIDKYWGRFVMRWGIMWI